MARRSGVVKALRIRAAHLAYGLLLSGLLTASAQEAEWAVVFEGDRQNFGGWGLSFVNANTGWVVGGMSDIDRSRSALVGYRTVDGGASWQDMVVPDFHVMYRDGAPVIHEQGSFERLPGPSPYSVQLLTPLEGWIGGAERLAHSVDGGRTWELIHISPGIIDSPEVLEIEAAGRLSVYGVHFENSSEGIIMCVAQQRGEGELRGSLVLATADGGASWRHVASSKGDPPLGPGMSMLSLTEGWSTSTSFIGLPSGLQYTRDGWRTWTSLLNVGVAAAHFRSDGRAWAITALFHEQRDFSIAHSTDGGVTWTPSEFDGELPDDLAALYAIRGLAFDGGTRGWALGSLGVVGGDGYVLTTDDGVTWRLEATVPGISLAGIQYMDGAVYAVGGRPDSAGHGSIIKRVNDVTGVRA